jgi:hypothetical protein
MRTEACECDLTGVHVMKYGTPTAPRYQPDALPPQRMTYVFAAPDFSRSAGSTAKLAAAGFSRTLEGLN